MIKIQDFLHAYMIMVLLYFTFFRKNIITVIKSKTQRNSEQQLRIDQGLKREVLFDLFIYYSLASVFAVVLQLPIIDYFNKKYPDFELQAYEIERGLISSIVVFFTLNLFKNVSIKVAVDSLIEYYKYIESKKKLDKDNEKTKKSDAA